jgi:hypothetical protein
MIYPAGEATSMYSSQDVYSYVRMDRLAAKTVDVVASTIEPIFVDQL